MSQVICPLCGKFVSVRYYDPSDFEEDIYLVKVRGLGRGKGVEIVEKYSLLDGSDPDLLNLISERVKIVYELLYEDDEDDEEDAEDEGVEIEYLSETDKFLRSEREAEEVRRRLAELRQ